MRLYIDGYNLLHALQIDQGSLKEDREELFHWLISRPLPSDVTLVFDGSGEAPGGHDSFCGLEIRYASHGESADEYLLKELAYLAPREPCALVTNDRRLLASARQLKVITFTCREWIQFIQKRSREGQEPSSCKPEGIENEEEKARWIALFTRKRIEQEKEDEGESRDHI